MIVDNLCTIEPLSLNKSISIAIFKWNNLLSIRINMLKLLGCLAKEVET
jgi:hypothetical protein